VGCDVVAHNSNPMTTIGIDSSIPRRKPI